MANEKTYSYLSSINEISKESDAFSNSEENRKAIKQALRRDYEGALESFTLLENEEMVFIIKKCIELQPVFEQFLNGDIVLSKYKRICKKFPELSVDIVHYKYPNLEFIELKNLERKFREKIEGIIDDLLSKNTLEALIEAKKVHEKNIGVVKKAYNFDKLFLKTISFIPFTEFEKLYYVEWKEVESLINGYLLDQAKDFTKAEKIINEIKVIDKNRDTILLIIRKFNKAFDARLRQYYNEAKLKNFVREYNKHKFYTLDKKNKVSTTIEPFFLQRRIYSIFYLNENYELFLEMLKANMDCMEFIPYENQKTYYHAIIKSIRIRKDYSIFEFFPEKIFTGKNFNDVIEDSLEEDEETIRGIVELLKGKENQQYMEDLFLKIFKKELTFSDTKKAPEFNKENAEILINKYKENDSEIHKMKARKVLYKILAAVELILSGALALGLASICSFAFKKEIYFVAVILLLAGIVLGIWAFVRLEEIITINRERRLLKANQTIETLESENNIILKKVYLGID